MGMARESAARVSARGSAARESTSVTPFGVDSALRQMSALPLWPGFEPARTPVAIYDGRNTTLFRHPRSPPGYVSLSRAPGVWARVGRDSAITANSSATIGGVPAATVMLDPTLPRDARGWAALTMHEIFHVFQRRRHPSWQANEMDLFTYPVDDSAALARRAAETAALHRALEARSEDPARCWGRAMIAERSARFAAIGGAAAAYERGTELNEGLAQYVERRAAGARSTIAEQDVAPDQVRQRAYEVGAAMAELLDRLAPAWRARLEEAPASDRLTLDGLLSRAVAGPRGETGAECSFTAAERGSFATWAGAEVRALAARRERTRAAFLDQPGWRVVIEAGASPLFPQRFDPLNVARVSPTEILHSRFVRLGNEAGSVEVLQRASLSEGRAGQHPLFGGVRRLTLAGLATPPSLRDSVGTLLLTADGVSGRWRGGRADTTSRTVTVRLP
jgi:hypothetical protein